jgi:hypothetical protein
MKRVAGKFVFGILALAGVALAGCGVTAQKYTDLAWAQITGETPVVTREQAAAIPYASIGVQSGNSNQVVLVLGTIQDGSAQWLSRQILVTTRDGRIVETAGFPNNLTKMDFAGGPPLPRAGTRYALLFDLEDLGVFGARAECAMADKGPEAVTILGANIPTRHLVEDCDMHLIGWSFENEFWLDAKTGFVWQSIQYVHPKLPPLTVQVFRPPQG